MADDVVQRATQMAKQGLISPDQLDRIVAQYGMSPQDKAAMSPETFVNPVADKMVRSTVNGALAPGRALNSKEPLTSEDMIAPAADMAGLVTLGAGVVPAEANSLRAGIRPYQNVPQPLMGYRKSGPQKGFDETNYSHTQPVEVTFKNGDSFTDAVKGMNPDHALERAYRNWPDAIHIRAITPPAGGK